MVKYIGLGSWGTENAGILNCDEKKETNLYLYLQVIHHPNSIMINLIIKYHISQNEHNNTCIIKHDKKCT